MNEALEFSTEALLGSERLGLADDAAYVSWAITRLSEGLDSPNLRMLAGLEPLLNHFEVKHHFIKALKELRIERKSEKEEIESYVTEVAQAVVNGRIQPKVAVATMNSICIASDYPSELMGWYALDDARMDLEYGTYPHAYPKAYNRDFSEVVIEYAQEYLKERLQQDAAQ